MFTYYYRIWRRIKNGGYDKLSSQGMFQANDSEEAYSKALGIVQSWGRVFGDCSLEFATALNARSPYVVYYPPF